jgi:hypothetical protein
LKLQLSIPPDIGEMRELGDRQMALSDWQYGRRDQRDIGRSLRTLTQSMPQQQSAKQDATAVKEEDDANRLQSV